MPKSPEGNESDEKFSDVLSTQDMIDKEFETPVGKSYIIKEAQKYDKKVSTAPGNEDVKSSDALEASSLWETAGELKKAYDVLLRATSVLGFYRNKSYPEIYQALDDFVKRNGLISKLSKKARQEWEDSIKRQSLPISHHDIEKAINEL